MQKHLQRLATTATTKALVILVLVPWKFVSAIFPFVTSALVFCFNTPTDFASPQLCDNVRL